MLSALNFFACSTNKNLSGSVPGEFQNLTSVEEAYFHDTKISSGLETLFCGQGLEVFYADCGGSVPDVICGCCTHCCESDGTSCQARTT